MASSEDQITFRTKILTRHLNPNLDSSPSSSPNLLSSSPCLSYTPPELVESEANFDTKQMRSILDSHNINHRDWLYNIMIQSNLFNPSIHGHRKFVCPDYNQSMEQQREITVKRIEYLRDCGVFLGWLTGDSEEDELRKMALNEVLAIYDHSLAIKLGVHFFSLVNFL
uniref:Uncharacterized protein n=1 Tax=Chenopodium quinoa TaxID=63459 RepID=A0A803MW09_CHEQI